MTLTESESLTINSLGIGQSVFTQTFNNIRLSIIKLTRTFANSVGVDHKPLTIYEYLEISQDTPEDTPIHLC
jgi:hypothetical protein